MQANPVELLDLLPDVAFAQGHVDHGRLDVGVPHRFHNVEGISPRHGHLSRSMEQQRM